MSLWSIVRKLSVFGATPALDQPASALPLRANPPGEPRCSSSIRSGSSAEPNGVRAPIRSAHPFCSICSGSPSMLMTGVDGRPAATSRRSTSQAMKPAIE